MAEDRASIDGATILDNAAARQVEFSAEVGGDWYPFALHYSALEALAGMQIGDTDNVAAMFGQFRAEAEAAAARALSRGPADGGRIAIGEGDLL